jgi:GntR family transcriptional regulator
MIDSLEPEVIVHGGKAVHRQLHDQIRGFIVRGILRPGEELPTVRSAAVELAVSPYVVQRAYAELEREGYVTQDDGGVFIDSAPRTFPPALVRFAEEFTARAAKHGFEIEEVIKAIEHLVRTGTDKNFHPITK